MEPTHEFKIGSLPLRLVPRSLLGKEPHERDPVPFLAPQISSTAELTYADIDRRREVAFAIDDASGGLSEHPRFALSRQNKILWSKNADTSVPGVVLCGPKVTTLGSVLASEPTKAIQRGDITYIAAGTRLYQVTNSTTATLDTTFSDAITDLVEFGADLVVAFGAGVDIQSRASDSSGGAFTTQTGDEANFLVVDNDTIWRALTPSSLFATDVLTGTWAEYDVGDSAWAITGLELLTGGVMLVGKEDGVYVFDSQFTAQNIVPELKIQADSQVGKAHAVFDRDGYFSSRLGIVRIAPGEGLEMVGLEFLADAALPGGETRPTSMTTDGRFLYVNVIPSGTDGIYIWKRDRAGNWHNYIFRTDLAASAELLFATPKLGSTSVNAILFAYASGANWQLAYARFPATLDPRDDTAYTFDDDTTGVFRTLEYVASYPTIPKYADRIKVVADDLVSTRTVTVDIYADNEDAKEIASVSASPNVEEVLRAPVDFHRAALEFDLETASTSTSPALRAFHLTVVPLPPVVTLHTIHIQASSDEPLLSGGRATGPYLTVLNKLRDLRKDRKSHECVDEDRRRFTAYIEDIWERTLWVKAGDGFTPSKMIVTTLKEVER